MSISDTLPGRNVYRFDCRSGCSSPRPTGRVDRLGCPVLRPIGTERVCDAVRADRPSAVDLRTVSAPGHDRVRDLAGFTTSPDPTPFSGAAISHWMSAGVLVSISTGLAQVGKRPSSSAAASRGTRNGFSRQRTAGSSDFDARCLQLGRIDLRPAGPHFSDTLLALNFNTAALKTAQDRVPPAERSAMRSRDWSNRRYRYWTRQNSWLSRSVITMTTPSPG